jgi:P4 family phage/plasmid primase-like protien
MAQNYKRGEFCNYLQRYRVEKMSVFTHTSIVKPSGAFYIPTEEIDVFYEMYKTAFAAGEDLYMTERHKEVSPFLIDLDFRFEKTQQLKRYYTQDDLHNIVMTYMQCIGQYIEIPNDVSIYILEKPYPIIDKGLIKDGVHIMIPSIVTKPSVQYLVRKDVIALLQPMFEALGCANHADDIIDEAVIERNNWQMYGSKKPNCEAYDVTCMYVYDKENASLQQASVNADKKEFVEFLSIRNKYDACIIKFDKENAIKEFEDVIAAKKKKNMQNNPILQSSRNNKKNVVENLEHIEKMVDALCAARANSYSDWIRVGWCLRNIDYRLLPKWIEFSKKSPKFVDGECERLWNHMRDDGLGIGTLYLWAKTDDPEQYKEIMDTDISNLIYTSRNETHFDIARVVHFMFKHEFVCASIKHNYWFQFRDHRWVPCDCGYTLNHKLSTDVWKQYTSTASRYYARASTTENESEQTQLQDTAKKLAAIAQKLKTVAFKENVMTECRRLFYVERFEEKLDSRCQLIGFENGVYDLELKEFREGRPEDFISFTTGCNYNPYEPEHPFTKQIMTFLSQILPKEHMKEYALLLLASFLNGQIREERFHIWTGSGCHAIDAPIMMFDGSTKKVQDIQVGEQLMGDNSQPRNVLQLFRGHADMYEIIPTKGDKFTVNGDHILSLKITNTQTIYWRKARNCWCVSWQEFDTERFLVNKSKNFKEEDEATTCFQSLQNNKNVCKKGDVIDISVKDFLENKTRLGERNFSLYRPALDFPSQTVEIDPWFMGYWLGNGHSDMPFITTMFEEVVNKTHTLYQDTHDINVYVKPNNKAVTLGITNNKHGDCFWKKFTNYGLKGNKHIPSVYLQNDRETRLKLLAGILDSDGHYQPTCNQFELTFKNERLLNDTMHLARSLGFACYKHSKTATWTHNGVKKSGTYYRVQIVGDGIEDIPCVLPFKRAQPRKKNKDVQCVSFKINRIEDGDFYGFELDGNHRYLMEDFTVQHNSNGKSKLIDLYEQSFGDYCCKFPVTLLTQKRAASNAATSELARAKGKRFVVMQEPSEDEKLNVGLMKELSGGDKIQARALFKEPIEFKPQFKMVLTCNHLPNVPSDDGGTWRRIRLVEFTSKFTATPDPTKENEFPIDMELSNKFVDWREHFMSLLIEYYKKYCETGIKEPDEVMQCTREYQKNNDFYLEFVESELERYDMGFLSYHDAYNLFKQWQKDNASSFKVKKKEFALGVDKSCGRRISLNGVEGWKGWRIKSVGQGVFANDDEDDPLA